MAQLGKYESKFDQAVDYACSEFERVGKLEKLDVPVRVVLLVQAAQGIIDNGGLHYFFESDFPGQPPYSVFVDAYREIGATQESEALANAVSLFPFSNPHKIQRRRAHFLKQQYAQAESQIWNYDGCLCGSEVVWKLLAKYIRTYAKSFPKQLKK